MKKVALTLALALMSAPLTAIETEKATEQVATTVTMKEKAKKTALATGKAALGVWLMFLGGIATVCKPDVKDISIQALPIFSLGCYSAVQGLTDLYRLREGKELDLESKTNNAKKQSLKERVARYGAAAGKITLGLYGLIPTGLLARHHYLNSPQKYNEGDEEVIMSGWERFFGAFGIVLPTAAASVYTLKSGISDLRKLMKNSSQPDAATEQEEESENEVSTAFKN